MIHKNISNNSSFFIDERDERIYKTHKFGKQIWMCDNFSYECKNSWYYDNDQFYGLLGYGRLYTWEAAMKTAPESWHLPSDEEWDMLIGYLGGEKIAYEKLKNEKFQAKLSGYRYENNSFINIDSYAAFWSSSQYDTIYSWSRYIYNIFTEIYRGYSDKNCGFSVRYVKD